MAALDLVERLDGVRETGRGRWIARCPAHADRSPSLSVREKGDGLVLVRCFAGCEVQSVIDAVGLTFSHLYPDSPVSHRVRRINNNARDLLSMARHESMIVALAGEDLINGKPLNEADQTRLIEAVKRIRTLADG